LHAWEREQRGDERGKEESFAHTDRDLQRILLQRKRVLWGRRGEGVGVLRDRAKASGGGPNLSYSVVNFNVDNVGRSLGCSLLLSRTTS
jgi:hypothetical protein